MIDPRILWGGELSIIHDRRPAVLLTMLACRGCSWAMKKRGPLWACENWRPWNFWRHDLMRRTPTHRSVCM